jgi:hypothetical protein
MQGMACILTGYPQTQEGSGQLRRFSASLLARRARRTNETDTRPLQLVVEEGQQQQGNDANAVSLAPELVQHDALHTAVLRDEQHHADPARVP